MSGRPNVCFVVPRYGADIDGGAERFARGLALQMQSVWNIDVLTTCATDYRTWRNEFEPGESMDEGIRVRRFPVIRERDPVRFGRISESLSDAPWMARAVEVGQWIREQGPDSPELIAYLRVSSGKYEAVFFFSYLYATTFEGIQLVNSPAVLIPFAHDEWPVRMPEFRRVFESARHIVYQTPEEGQFIEGLFGDLRAQEHLIPFAIEPQPRGNAQRFREQFGIHSDFILYLGRIDASKGCGRLVDDFLEFRRKHTSPAQLILAGRTYMTIPPNPRIQCVGYLSEEQKADALAACELVVMPSAYESLSLVLLEAWSAGRAVLVNSRSRVLVGQCRRSNGGLWYANADEFTRALLALDPLVRLKLGEQGRQFVNRQYTWRSTRESYAALL